MLIIIQISAVFTVSLSAGAACFVFSGTVFVTLCCSLIQKAVLLV